MFLEHDFSEIARCTGLISRCFKELAVTEAYFLLWCPVEDRTLDFSMKASYKQLTVVPNRLTKLKVMMFRALQIEKEAVSSFGLHQDEKHEALLRQAGAAYLMSRKLAAKGEDSFPWMPISCEREAQIPNQAPFIRMNPIKTTVKDIHGDFEADAESRRWSMSSFCACSTWRMAREPKWDPLLVLTSFAYESASKRPCRSSSCGSSNSTGSRWGTLSFCARSPSSTLIKYWWSRSLSSPEMDQIRLGTGKIEDSVVFVVGGRLEYQRSL